MCLDTAYKSIAGWFLHSPQVYPTHRHRPEYPYQTPLYTTYLRLFFAYHATASSARGEGVILILISPWEAPYMMKFYVATL